MKAFLADASHAFWIGCVIAAVVLVFWVSEAPGDALGTASVVARFVHIGSVIIWIGSLWFVNFVPIFALGNDPNAVHGVLLTDVMPRLATFFGLASHVVVVSGAVLLLTNGYFFDRWVFPSAVYIPPAQAAMVWGGALLGLVMWGLVQKVLRPNLQTMLDQTATFSKLEDARSRILLAARLNLLLAVPVMFAMVAAAHLS